MGYAIPQFSPYPQKQFAILYQNFIVAVVVVAIVFAPLQNVLCFGLF